MARNNRRLQVRRIVALLLVGLYLAFGPTGYQLLRPGSAENLSDIVQVEGGKTKQGNFYMLTVSHQQASPLGLLYGLVNPQIDLQPSSRVIPPGWTREEYNEYLNRLMEESQALAKVVALRRLGYDVGIRGDGVEVVELGEDSPAKGLLFPGDVVLAVDGEEVTLADEMVNLVKKRRIGETVALRIRRNDREETVVIPTVSHTDYPEQAAVRIYVQTLNWEPSLPLDVKIDVGKIAGPSAGLMFTLEIMNQLGDQDLAGGRKIAGTGQINLHEEVGAIGGVRQKVAAAEEVGAEVFLVPVENYEDAVSAARRITVIPVKTLSDALEYLGSSLQKAA